MKLSKELAQLLEAVCLGELTDQQRARLEELVTTDETARRHYVRYLTMHALAERFEGSKAADEAERLAEQLSESNSQPAARPSPCDATHKSLPLRVYCFFAQPTPLSMSVAAIFVGLLITVMAVVTPPFNRVPSPPEVSNGKFGVFSARVTGLQSNDRGEIQLGMYLTAGQDLKLADGVLEITFESGARSIVEGPARLQITSDNGLRLIYGAAVGIVPEAAAGFSIETRYCRFVDVGTEFGVKVADDGSGVVEVFEGVIEVHRASDAADVVRLQVGDRLRFDASGQRAELPGAATHGFVLVFPRELGMHLVNGNFEQSPVDSCGSFPPPWYSGHPDSWEEFRHAGLGKYSGTAAALGYNPAQNGYIYQCVGEYRGETSITVTGSAYNRTDMAHRFGDFDVAFFFTRGREFRPAEGVDVAKHGTIIGQATEFEEGVNLPNLQSGAVPTASAFSHTVSFTDSGIAKGDLVFLRIGDGDNVFGGNANPAPDEPFIDDLQITTVGP